MTVFSTFLILNFFLSIAGTAGPHVVYSKESAGDGGR